MSLRLKSHNTSPPGGFRFIDPSTGFKAHGWSVSSCAALWYHEQLRLGRTPTLDQCRQDVVDYTCADLMKTSGWQDWVIMDKPFSVADLWNEGHNEQPPFTADQTPFIQLGRFGDLILLLPAFRAIQQRTGKNPVVLVGREYASVFDGVTYATPLPVPWHWWSGIPNARQLSRDIFGQETVLQCHGADWGVDMAKSGSFMESMWQRAGFTKDETLALPLVFDRRDAKREQKLVARYKGKRPLILTKLSGVSSPFNHTPTVSTALSVARGHADVLSLDGIQAERIYDLLGLIDVAAGLITIDTSTLHLAAASKTPYIAFSTEKWNGSTPKGNCVFNCRYSEAPNHTETIKSLVNQWI